MVPFLSKTMSEKKCYQNKDTTRAKLTANMRDMVQCGLRDLPSERELCAATGGSRKVIRELISEMEKSGILLRRNNKREIVGFRKFAVSVPVLYSALGRNMVWNCSWARLHYLLERIAPDYGVDLRLMLAPWPWKTAMAYQRQIRNDAAKYLIITDTYETLAKNNFDFADKFCIFTDQDNVKYAENVVSVDNEEVGRTAARELHAAGYRTPALFFEEHTGGYLPFLKRKHGFLDECARLGIALNSEDLYVTAVHRHKSSLKDNLLRLLEAGELFAKRRHNDSFFAITDERVPLLCDVIREGGIYPADLGIISFNATNCSMHSRSPFATVSSASTEIANTILTAVAELENGRRGSFGHIAIKPTVHNRELLSRNRK